MALYVPKHFELHELLSPVIHGKVKHRRAAWQIFDVYCLVTNDRLRERYGPITINNWFWDGEFRFSGFRPENCPEGASLSVHKRGAAFDLKFRDVTADEVRTDLKDSPGLPCFEYVHRVEEFKGMSWFHYDRGNVVPGSPVVFFNPKG